MPIYEYRCSECGEQTEVFHRRRNEPVPKCPSCDQETLERLISRTNFQLKGGGWYVTDYASGKGGGGDSAKSGDDSAKGSGDSAKSSGDSAKGSGDSAKSSGDAKSSDASSSAKSSSSDSASA